MRSNNKNDLLTTDTSLVNSITSFVENLDLIVKEFQDKFNKVYTLYLTTVEERNQTAKGSTIGVRMPSKSFEKVSRIYEHVSKTLDDFLKVFLHDFSDIAEIMLTLNTLKQKHQMLSIELSLDKDFLDEGQVYRKEDMISNVKKNYDKLALEFEMRNKELTALKKNLDRQVLIYYSLRTGRKFLLNLKGELAEFKYLVELDSKKYSDMIGEYSQLFGDQLKKLTLTPIAELKESFAASKVKPRTVNLTNWKTFAELNPEKSAEEFRKVQKVQPSKVEPTRSFAEQSQNLKFQLDQNVRKERKEPKKMEIDAEAGPKLADTIKTEGFNFKLPTVPKEPEIPAQPEAPRRRSAEEIVSKSKSFRTADDAPSLNLTVIENLVRTNKDSESNHIKLVNLALLLPSEIDHTKEELKVIARELNAMEKKKRVNFLYSRLLQEYHDLRSHLTLLTYWKKEIKIKLDSPDLLRAPFDYEFIPVENIPLMTLEEMESEIKGRYETMVRNLTMDNNKVLSSQLFQKFESNYPELLVVKDFRTFVEDYKNSKRLIVKSFIDLSTEEASTPTIKYLQHEVLASIITINYLYFLRKDFCDKYDQSSDYSEKRFYVLVTGAINRCFEMARAVNGNTLMIIRKLKKIGVVVNYENMMAPLAREISKDFAELSNQIYEILKITIDEERHILQKNVQKLTSEQIEKVKKTKTLLQNTRSRLEKEYYLLVQKQKSLMQ